MNDEIEIKIPKIILENLFHRAFMDVVIHGVAEIKFTEQEERAVIALIVQQHQAQFLKEQEEPIVVFGNAGFDPKGKCEAAYDSVSLEILDKIILERKENNKNE